MIKSIIAWIAVAFIATMAFVAWLDIFNLAGFIYDFWRK